MTKLKKILAAALAASLLIGFGANVASFASEASLLEYRYSYTFEFNGFNYCCKNNNVTISPVEPSACNIQILKIPSAVKFKEHSINNITEITICAELFPNLSKIILPEELAECKVSILRAIEKSYTLKRLENGEWTETTINSIPYPYEEEDMCLSEDSDSDSDPENILNTLLANEIRRRPNALGENIENAVIGSGRTVSYLEQKPTAQNIFLQEPQQTTNYWNYCPHCPYSCTLF